MQELWRFVHWLKLMMDVAGNVTLCDRFQDVSFAVKSSCDVIPDVLWAYLRCIHHLV